MTKHGAGNLNRSYRRFRSIVRASLAPSEPISPTSAIRRVAFIANLFSYLAKSNPRSRALQQPSVKIARKRPPWKLAGFFTDLPDTRPIHLDWPGLGGTGRIKVGGVRPTGRPDHELGDGLGTPALGPTRRSVGPVFGSNPFRVGTIPTRSGREWLPPAWALLPGRSGPGGIPSPGPGVSRTRIQPRRAESDEGWDRPAAFRKHTAKRFSEK